MAERWTPESWRSKPVLQMPHYPDAGALADVEAQLATFPPLVFAGEARNRTRLAVERTAPFGMLVQSLVIVWYHLAGHSPHVVEERRQRTRWYATKTHPSYQDMLLKLRRVLIAAQFRADPQVDPTLEQIHAIRLAWADAAA